MGIIQDFNTILLWFYKNQGYHSLTKGLFRGIDNSYMIIETLIKKGLLFKRGVSNGRYVYQIDADAVLFIDNLPEAQKNNPYGYFLELEKNKNPPLAPIIITGNNNAVGNSQTSFAHSFNEERHAEYPINNEIREHKKITPMTIILFLARLVSNNPLISSIVATIIATLLLKYFNIL